MILNFYYRLLEWLSSNYSKEFKSPVLVKNETSINNIV